MLDALSGRVEGWWPSDSPFEVIVGALLTQQTTWESVVPVLDALRSKGLLDVRAMAACEPEDLYGVVRPTGFFRQKCKRIVLVSRHIVEEHDGDPLRMLRGPIDEARGELLSLEGIGPETADSILLFAAGRPKFVAAAYVRRVFLRIGIGDMGYDEAQSFVEVTLGPDPDAFVILYSGIVEVAKSHCLTRPRCEGCPLGDLCVTAGGTAGSRL